MNILQVLQQLRDDIKLWVTNNLNALNAKIDEKTIPIDSELNSTSSNPVQNKAIAAEINDINQRVGDTSVANQISSAIAKQNHFSGDYNDLTNAPNIAEDDSGNMVIADESGNVIFKVDVNGLETTTVTAQTMVVNGANVENKFENLDSHIQNNDLHVAAAEKEVWNNKSEFSGSYTDLVNVPTDLATQTYVDDAVAGVTPESIGLGNVDNTSDVDKPVSTATRSALDELKTELSESIVAESEEWKVVDGAGNIVFSVDASGAHTTAISLNGIDVEDIIDQRVSSLVDSAPETLNTLNELANALGDDPNFAATIATEIGKKVDKENGKGLSTNDFTDAYREQLDELKNMTFEESDPTVPAWAKAENPPTYTAEDVGALPNDTPLFSGNYYDLENAPNITEDNEGNLVIADADGNIVFRSDANGFETTNLVAQTITINGSDLVALIKAEVKAYVEEYILGGEW